MKHSDFCIGAEFECGGKTWRCTDMGTRAIIAVCLSDHKDDPSWYNGPPYAVAEFVFDEDSIIVCEAMVATGDDNQEDKPEPDEAYPSRAEIAAMSDHWGRYYG